MTDTEILNWLSKHVDIIDHDGVSLVLHYSHEHGIKRTIEAASIKEAVIKANELEVTC